jgi:CATRA-associated small protein
MADEEDVQWRRARREAMATLRSALDWKLPPEYWTQMPGVLAEMASAARAAAPGALADATETLSFYIPVRVVTRLGDEPVAVPAFVREQIAELLNTLEPREETGRDGAGLSDGQQQAARRGA